MSNPCRLHIRLNDANDTFLCTCECQGITLPMGAEWTPASRDAVVKNLKCQIGAPPYEVATHPLRGLLLRTKSAR